MVNMPWAKTLGTRVSKPSSAVQTVQANLAVGAYLLSVVILGQLWLVLNPLLLAAVYYLLVTIIRGRHDPAFFAHLALGLFAFNMVATAMTTGTRSVVSSGKLLMNTPFPRLLIPLSAVRTAFFRFLPTVPVYFVFHLIFLTKMWHPKMLLALYFLGTMVVFSMGAAAFFAALVVYIIVVLAATPGAPHRAPAGTTRTVAYFHGCAAQEFEPEVGAAVVRVLERNGARVTFPKQGCCGLPLVSNGDFDAGRSYATRLVRNLRGAADDPGVIVASSTSCGMTLKAKYRELLGLDDADTKAVSQAVYDICEYLVGLDEDGQLNRNLAPIPARALYHPPCQLMAHGVGLPALDLLALVPGLEIERSRAGCCGTAGTYGTKVEKYQIAMDVGRTLFDQVTESRPDFIVCDSETCRWHIAKSTGLPVYHPVQVLDRAYATA